MQILNGFFDHINHNWMIKFLEYNIKDPNIIGLIKKYLKVGIMDKGQYVSTEEGSAQGNIISPVLANIYMHFVLVLWYKEIVQKRAKGDYQNLEDMQKETGKQKEKESQKHLISQDLHSIVAKAEVVYKLPYPKIYISLFDWK